MRKVATKTFKAELFAQGSWGSRKLGTYESTMDLFLSDDGWRGCIEWEIPDLENGENIGLWFDISGTGEARLISLSDYDGIMSLPKEAIELLESQGITVGREFR